MRKRHRRLAMALCLMISVISAAGCAGTEQAEGSKDANVSVVSTEDGKDSETAVKDDESAETVSEDAGGAETAAEGDEGAETAEEDSAAAVTIEEQTLVDQDGIVITAQEYVSDSIWGDGIGVLIENNSEKNMSVGCTALIVNDYMITDLFAAEVAAGKRANETIYLSSSELQAAGIDAVGKVEIYFHAYEMETMEDIFETDCVTIQTSAYENMDTTPNDMGTEIYNEGGIRIVSKAVDEDSFWGTAILLYCENTSGKNAGISVDNMSINGFMMDPFFSTTIYDGKKSIDDITVLSSDLEENGITSIDDVELQFHIYDADTYDTIADSEPIKLSVK